MAESLLSDQPHLRPEAASLISLGYFHSGAVATLRELDVLPSKDPASAGVIVSRLADRLSEFSPRMLTQVVLPPVLQAACSAPSLWLHAVPLILKVRTCVAGSSKGVSVGTGREDDDDGWMMGSYTAPHTTRHSSRSSCPWRRRPRRCSKGWRPP